MSHEPRKRGAMLPIVVTIGVLLGIYVGAYYATVRNSGWRNAAPQYTSLDLLLEQMRFPWLAPLFAPMHWIDCRLRPVFWETRIDWESDL